VTGVVDGLAHTPVNALTLGVALVAVLAGFGAWWTYFDFAGRRPPRPTRPATLVWMLTHLPLTAAALLTTSLRARRHQSELYRPLSLTCIAAAVLSLGLGIARPTPLVFGLALVVLFGISWAFAVAHRVTHHDTSPASAC
jgi:hypothetical protein